MTHVPEAGRVETRLIPDLEAEGAASLHQTLLPRTPQTAVFHQACRMLRSWRAVRTVAMLLMTLTCLLRGPLSAEDQLARIEQEYAAYHREFPRVADISVAEAAKLPPARIVWVDVRPELERMVSTIPNAITAQEFEQRRLQLPEDAVVVCYCTIGYRSGVYADRWLQSGADVRNLRGGILAWCHAGQEVANAQGPTRRVHVYGRRWNLLPEAYEAVW